MRVFALSPSTDMKVAAARLAAVLILLSSEILHAAADVVAVAPDNSTSTFQSLPADFGPSIKPSGMEGFLVTANPPDACQAIEPPPAPPVNETWQYPFFALIVRGGCDFDRKVYNAQKAQYMGAIVYNNDGNVLTRMSGGTVGSQVLISSVFVGLDSGTALQQMNYTTGFEVVIFPGFVFPYHLYLIPFASIVGICFIVMLFFMIAKYVRDQRRRRKARLSRDHLKKLPTKKFKKGDEYDVCAICLDDYEEGQKLRILPCNHAFHCKCVDPWLTNNRRTCPICKRKVIPPGMVDSDEESDSEAGDAPDESTPLLAGMERDDSGERGAVGGVSDLNTPPPSPVTPQDYEDEGGSLQDQPVGALINVDSDSESAGSYPLEEAAGGLDRPAGQVLSVTVHSENETDPGTSHVAKA